MEYTKIQELASKLSYEWFLLMKKTFQEETFYDSDKNKIVDIPLDSDFDGGVVIFSKNSMDLNRYSWNSFFPGSLNHTVSQLEEAPIRLPLETKDVAKEILQVVMSETQGMKAAKAVDNYIHGVLKTLETEFISMAVTPDDYEYDSVLTFFLYQVRVMVSKEFAIVKKEIELTEYEDRLEFKLSQEELAALLYVLNKAGVLNTSDFNDTSFLHFCQKYFYFSFKDKFKKPSSFSSLSDKYREFVRGENGRNLDKMKDRLIRTIKNI